jgi:hypothetical protein
MIGAVLKTTSMIGAVSKQLNLIDFIVSFKEGCD